MARTIITAFGVVVLSFGAAPALDVGVGAFYAPAFVTGAETVSRELSGGGFKGNFSLGISEGIKLTLGYGYNYYRYPRGGNVIEEIEIVNAIPASIITAGADYGFAFGPVSPFVGGGAAIARESVQDYWHETVDWCGGVYAEGGARYFVADGLALEAGPRYTLLFDKPVVYDDLNLPDFVRSEHRSQLVELLVGVNYYF
jgi:opacity protein-like surface antigen